MGVPRKLTQQRLIIHLLVALSHGRIGNVAESCKYDAVVANPSACLLVASWHGRVGNVVTSVKCTVTTDLAEVRHRLETVLLPSELNYAFYSITGQ
jgi:hypothetical protein